MNTWLNSHVLEIKSLPWQVQEEEGDGRADEDDGQVALLGGQGGGAAAVLALSSKQLASFLKYIIC